MFHCPNCHAALQQLDERCGACGADFGEGAGWKPMAGGPPAPRFNPAAATQPSYMNALAAPVLFALLGPPVGALAALLFADGRASLLHPAVSFFFVGAYAFGTAPAALAGLAFSAAASAAAFTFRPRRVPVVAAAILGGACGPAGLHAYWLARLGTASPTQDAAIELWPVAAVAGAICAAVAAWRLPIGSAASR